MFSSLSTGVREGALGHSLYMGAGGQTHVLKLAKQALSDESLHSLLHCVLCLFVCLRQSLIMYNRLAPKICQVTLLPQCSDC